MGIDYSKERFSNGYSSFSRVNLRKTMLFKGEMGTFAVVTKMLDRETLLVKTIHSFFLEESMDKIVGMYLKNYKPGAKTVIIL